MQGRLLWQRVVAIAQPGVRWAPLTSAAASGGPDAPTQRIAKRIAASHACSRRGAEQLLAEGRVRVNGVVVTSPAMNVALDDAVLVDGTILPKPQPPKMWLCYKLPGEIVTRRDPEGRPTLFERLAAMRIPGHTSMRSVGRLDYNSEGLLLLTSSGEVSRILELPSSAVKRQYAVKVLGRVSQHALRSLRRGVVHDGHRYRPVDVVISSQQEDHAWLDVTLTEGKNREIRKLMSLFGLNVERLIRIQYGPYKLGTLPKGAVLEVKVHPTILQAVEDCRE